FFRVRRGQVHLRPANQERHQSQCEILIEPVERLQKADRLVGLVVEEGLQGGEEIGFRGGRDGRQRGGVPSLDDVNIRNGRRRNLFNRRRHRSGRQLDLRLRILADQ